MRPFQKIVRKLLHIVNLQFPRFCMVTAKFTGACAPSVIWKPARLQHIYAKVERKITRKWSPYDKKSVVVTCPLKEKMHLWVRLPAAMATER